MTQIDLFAAPAPELACSRCGVPCRLGPPGLDGPEILILPVKSTAAGGGVCPSCHATAVLKMPNFPPADLLRQMLKEQRIAALRMPHIQAAFAMAIRAQPKGDQLPAAAIDWEKVIANWHLPHAAGTFPARQARTEITDQRRYRWKKRGA